MANRTLEDQLTLHEGKRPGLYNDGYGHMSIGVGRNLTDVPLDEEEISFLLAKDIRRAAEGLDYSLPWWSKLDAIRQRVMLDMCFNLGIGKLLTFRTTLANIKAGEYEAAAVNMLKSKWAKQVGNRALRLAEMMKTGQDYTR